MESKISEHVCLLRVMLCSRGMMGHHGALWTDCTWNLRNVGMRLRKIRDYTGKNEVCQCCEVCKCHRAPVSFGASSEAGVARVGMVLLDHSETKP